MSQVSRRTRVRQLADSVWPGRTVNGYANLIAARLRKLADEACTGVLPVSGRGDGAIFFRGGQVVYAESSRTSPPGPRATGLDVLGLRTSEVPGPADTHSVGNHGADKHSADKHGAGEAGLVPVRPGRKLGGMLEITELIIDALTELLSSESRYAKFRQAEVLPVGQGRPIAVETLLAEVRRRHEVLRQLAAVLTPDTPVTCDPSLDAPSAQVSPAQWALLARVSDGTTSRGLAVQQGRSVFGTTIEVYRLVQLGLLVAPERPAPAGEAGAQRPAGTMSFLRAVSGGRGSDA
jgi:Domain of unknown function (DUF4388)